MKLAIHALAASTIVALFSASAVATTLPSLDRATFHTAINGSTVVLQNFDSFANGTNLTSDGFVTYASSTGTPLITDSYLTSTSPNGLGRTGVGFFLSSDSATFTFNSAVTAFGIDINTFASTPGAYSVLLNTGDQASSIFETFPGVGTGEFIGFTSPTPFTSVTLSANTGFSYTLDTLIYGDAAAIGGVPEPSTWAMMLLGFAAIGVSIRRRRFAQRASLMPAA